MPKKNELVAKNDSDNLPAFMQGIGDTGMEEAEGSDFLIPMLKIIQKGSPQMDDVSPKYDPDAKVGNILNSASGELSETLEVVPVYFKKREIEWTPRDQGGGFVAEHMCGECKIHHSEMGKNFLENGNQLVKTYYIYALTATDEMIIIPFSGSGLKIGRQWLTLAQNTKLPLYASKYTLSTVTESNSLGSWKNYKIKRNNLVDEVTFDKAKDFLEMVKNNLVKADFEKPETVDTDKF